VILTRAGHADTVEYSNPNLCTVYIYITFHDYPIIINGALQRIPSLSTSIFDHALVLLFRPSFVLTSFLSLLSLQIHYSRI
jgi:hypothetical protein